MGRRAAVPFKSPHAQALFDPVAAAALGVGGGGGASGAKVDRRKRWEKTRDWKSRNKQRADTLEGTPEEGERRRGSGRKSRGRGVARELQFESKKEKYKDLRGRVQDAEKYAVDDYHNNATGSHSSSSSDSALLSLGAYSADLSFEGAAAVEALK